MICRVFLCLLLSSAAARSQFLMAGATQGGPILPLPSDAATLEAGDTRDDMSCTIKPVAPQLGFDLKFHAGYEVTLPLQELVGSGNLLTAVFRVSQQSRPGEPIYFVQKWSVPPLNDDARGKVDLRGFFALGEGKYQIAWLVHDRNDRVCSMRWPITAEPRGKDKQAPLALAPGTVQPDLADPFGMEAAPKRPDGAPLKVVVLFHVAPQASGAIAMRQTETSALLAILRRIAREPRIGAYCLVAFNLEQAEVLYRGHDMPQVDFPALGDAFKQLQLGRIDIQKLREKENTGDFLAGLIREEAAHSRPDAVILVGQRTSATAAIRSSLKELAPQCPIFNLSYVADPNANPFRDQVGNLVKFWKGSEYSISKPSDLFTAWKDVMSRIAARKTLLDIDSSPAVTSLTPKQK